MIRPMTSRVILFVIVSDSQGLNAATGEIFHVIEYIQVIFYEGFPSAMAA